jgi:hypothetical protein
MLTIWQIVEKVIGYCFIITMLIICSKTLVSWNDSRRIDGLRNELRKEFKSENKVLQDQIMKLQVTLDNYNISQTERMDVIEKQK